MPLASSTALSTLRAAAGLAFAAVLAGLAAAPAAAADFYAGKQVKLLVSTEAATTYDVYARLIAEYMPKHIPGRPNFRVENTPGASGLKVTNFMVSSAPADGTVLAAVHSSIPTAPLTSPDGARFDATKLAWIGSITKDPFIGYTWHTSPVKTLADARTKPFSVGGNAVGAAGVDYAILANELFGFHIKIITGYKGSVDTKLAMERGEVDGTFANGWGSIKTAEPAWITEKKINILVQHGFIRHPELPDVPLFVDLATKPEDRQALEFLLARQEFSKPYFAPPGTPADRLAVLRQAFDETMKDPAFVAAVNKAKLSVEGPMGGEELAAMVSRVSATPQSVVKRVEGLFDKFRKGQ